MNDLPKIAILVLVSPVIVVLIPIYGVGFPIVMFVVFLYYVIKPNRADKTKPD
jgi:hypothetical protein